jgi:hypothetical protein
MSRALLLGTLLFAGLFLGMCCAQNSWAQNSSAQDKTEPTRTGPPLPVYKNDISVGLFLPGRHRLLIRLSGRRIEPRPQVELVPGNGILRWQRKRSGSVL